jgi:hypothetical protein
MLILLSLMSRYRICLAVESGFFVVIRSAALATTDLGDQDDLALGLKRGEIGVLIDLTVDRQRHALVDLVPQVGKAAIELEDQAADNVRLEFGQPAGEPAGCLARDDDTRQSLPPAVVDRGAAAGVTTSAGHCPCQKEWRREYAGPARQLLITGLRKAGMPEE